MLFYLTGQLKAWASLSSHLQRTAQQHAHHRQLLQQYFSQKVHLHLLGLAAIEHLGLQWVVLRLKSGLLLMQAVLLCLHQAPAQTVLVRPLMLCQFGVHAWAFSWPSQRRGLRRECSSRLPSSSRRCSLWFRANTVRGQPVVSALASSAC